MLANGQVASPGSYHPVGPPMDRAPLAPVPATAHPSLDEASCPCLLCHEVCVLGPVRLTFLAWLSAAACLVACAYYVLAVDPVAAVVFAVNVPVLWRLWWRTPELRAAASADMLFKIFGFTFFVGGLLASLLEVVLMLVGGLILFDDGQDVSKVPAWCAAFSSLAPGRCHGLLQAQEAADHETSLYLAKQGYVHTRPSCNDTGGLFPVCTCQDGGAPPPCPWLHGSEQIPDAEMQPRLQGILQHNCTALRHIL
eukprot:COSAG05_NODE_2200_length_3407_cov_25.853109_4_plen_253_part_00